MLLKQNKLADNVLEARGSRMECKTSSEKFLISRISRLACIQLSLVKKKHRQMTLSFETSEKSLSVSVNHIP
jgi:hypothetical protein